PPPAWTHSPADSSSLCALLTLRRPSDTFSSAEVFLPQPSLAQAPSRSTATLETYSPRIFVPGFFVASLVATSLAVRKPVLPMTKPRASHSAPTPPQRRMRPSRRELNFSLPSSSLTPSRTQSHLRTFHLRLRSRLHRRSCDLLFRRLQLVLHISFAQGGEQQL